MQLRTRSQSTQHQEQSLDSSAYPRDIDLPQYSFNPRPPIPPIRDRARSFRYAADRPPRGCRKPLLLLVDTLLHFFLPPPKAQPKPEPSPASLRLRHPPSASSPGRPSQTSDDSPPSLSPLGTRLRSRLFRRANSHLRFSLVSTSIPATSTSSPSDSCVPLSSRTRVQSGPSPASIPPARLCFRTSPTLIEPPSLPRDSRRRRRTPVEVEASSPMEL